MRTALLRSALPALLLAALITPAAAFEVGRTSRVYVDADRGGRSVGADVYYPADVAGVDVPPAAGAARFAAVSFGHGFLIGTAEYAYLGEALAGAGFIALVPETEGGFGPDHEALGLDLAFVLRAIRAEGEDAGSLFFERVAETSAVGGHSMGGGASLLAAASDPAITAVFNLAAAETNPSAIAAAAAVTAPALIFAASNDCVTPPETNQIPMYDALASACRTYVEVVGASHCQFAAPNGFCSTGELFCSPPEISRGEQQGIVVEYLVPFLGFVLDGDGGAWVGFQELLAGDGRVTSVQDCEVVGVPGASAAQVPALVVRAVPVPSAGGVELLVGDDGPVSVAIVDAQGRLVRRLETAGGLAGGQVIRWDGRDVKGGAVPSGVYIARVTQGARMGTERVVLVR